jgi:hypothetical protein
MSQAGEDTAIHPARVIRARAAAVLAADGEGFETRPVDQVTVDFEGVVLDGLRGERHRGLARPADARVPWFPRGTPIRNSRHLSLVSQDELDAVAAELGLSAIEPSWLGANLVIEGVPALSMLPRGSRLVFPQATTLAVEEQNAPCRKSGHAVARRGGGDARTPFAFVRAARRRRGLVAWVERPGLIRVGDAVEVRIPEQWIYA